MSAPAEASAAGAIRRALALLAAASGDYRLKGPSNGATPLHWPIATRAARAQLEHALTLDDERDREIARLRAALRDYLDASDACTMACADREAWERAHGQREAVRTRAREILASTATAPEPLARIMELQAIEDRTAEQNEELYRLETEWRNRAIDPSECP